MARHGTAWPGVARRSKGFTDRMVLRGFDSRNGHARYGAARRRLARRGAAWLRRVGPGEAPQGTARQGRVITRPTGRDSGSTPERSRFGRVWPGAACPGAARLGAAGRGPVRQGKAWVLSDRMVSGWVRLLPRSRAARLRAARRGLAVLRTAGPGSVGHSKARVRAISDK